MSQPARVLIVEDEAIVAEDLAKKVAALGYQVSVTVPTGELAIQLAQDRSPDLVLLDVKLAGELDGIQTAERLQALGVGAIVFVTAHSDRATVDRAKHLGYFGFVLKPFSERELALQLDIALYKAETGRALRQQEESLRRANEELAQETASLTRLTELSSSLWRHRTLRDGLQEILLATIELLGADKGNIQLLNDAGVFVIAAHQGFDQESVTFFREVSIHDQSACGRALRAGQRVVIDDVEADPEFVPMRQIARHAGYRSVQSTPLLGKSGSAIGMVSTHWQAVHRPTENEFHRLDLYVRLAVDFIERVKAEGALQENQERLRAIVETAVDGIITIDEIGRIESVNPAVEKLFQYSPAELIGQNIKLLMPEPDPQQHDQYLRHYRQTGEKKIIGVGREVMGRRKDGTLLPLGLSISESRLPGKRFFTGILHDMTEHKGVEQALRSSEQWLRSFLNNSAIIAWLKDEKGRNVFLSENYVRRFGLRDWQDKTDLELWPPDIAEAFRRDDLMVFASDEPLEVVEQVRTADGTVSFWLNSKFWFQDASGQKFVGGVGVDITARKKAEAALRESEERLRLANLATNEAIWDWNVVTDTVVWNQNVTTIFGWSEAEKSPQTAAWWIERVHPEDRTRVVDHFFAVANDPAIVSWTDEYRFQKSDGGYSYVLDRAYAIRDASGRAVRMLGTMLDITETMEARQRLEHFTEDLERQVAVRTAEVVKAQDRLRALSIELSLAEQRERKRLAIELHDHLQQLLVLGKIQIGQGKRYALGVPGCETVMKKVDEILSEALTYTRTLVADLSPSVLRDHGLAAGLKWLGESMKKYDLLVTVTVPEKQTVELPEDKTVLLFQSVRELLMNASKHARSRQAMVNMAENEGRLEISVRDTGAGFDLAAAAAAESTPTAGTFSKFGLFSIRERMRAVGGFFDIQSKPGKGTLATLTIHLDQRDIRQSEERPLLSVAPSPRREGRNDRFVRVLLVDDHEMVRQGLRSILAGFSDLDVVDEAANGIEALVAVEAHRPAVVVMDINMPKMDGIEATARIKAKFPEIHVIGLSVNVGNENRQAMLKAGAATLITKEAAVESLYRTILDTMGRDGLTL
ncbi:MAG TPA: PAS domain S-box protein [Nitrospira sp.]|nr:PAS domain S-box protein [Nitrospira sp.]